MRIIGGSLAGRAISAPRAKPTRPMSDMVREALFNTLGTVEGRDVLDAYAGSGAVGFEALSRGALTATGIESNRIAARTINENIKNIGHFGKQYTLEVSRLEAWLKGTAKRYDLIIADPPYDELDPAVLDDLGNLLRPSGIMVVSHAGRQSPPTLQSVQLVQSRRYGDSALSFYKK